MRDTVSDYVLRAIVYFTPSDLRFGSISLSIASAAYADTIWRLPGTYWGFSDSERTQFTIRKGHFFAFGWGKLEAFERQILEF